MGSDRCGSISSSDISQNQLLQPWLHSVFWKALYLPSSPVLRMLPLCSGHLMKGYQYMKKFAILCPAITFCICLFGLLLNKPLLSLFGLGTEAMFFGKYMLLIYLAAGTIRTCNYIMNSCYRAGGEAVFGTLLEIICLFTWAAGMIWHLPFLAVFSFLYTDELIRLAFELWYTRSGKWIKPVTRMGRDALPEFQAELKQMRH